MVLLGGYAYRGIFSRYLQDDYCYGAEVVALGFFPAQIDSYFHQMPYNSERFSLTLFSGIAEVSGGPRLAPFLAGISIAVWAAALYFAFTQWNLYFQYQFTRLALLACALAVPIFTFFLAPNLYQVLYWRSAMLPYLTPLIFNTGLLGGFFAILRRGKLTPGAAIVFGLTGFVAGGFSETAGLWQFTLWCLVLIFSWLLNRRERLALIVASIAIAASALAIGIMLLGPSNSAQLQPFQRPGFAGNDHEIHKIHPGFYPGFASQPDFDLFCGGLPGFVPRFAERARHTSVHFARYLPDGCCWWRAVMGWFLP